MLDIPLDFFDTTFLISPAVAAITAAFYIALYHEEKSANSHLFKNLSSNIEFDASEAAVHLLRLSREFASLIKLKGSETNIKTIYNHMKNSEILLENNQVISSESQIIVLHQKTGTILEMIPSTFDDSTRKLYLVGEVKNFLVLPHSIVTNIMKYLTKGKQGYLCFYCGKRFSGKGTKHRCKKRRSCFVCHRPTLKETTFVDLVTKDLYCRDELEPKIANFCKVCNLSIRNESCQACHQKFVCRWGWFCLQCQKYTFRSKYLPTIKKIMESHDCKAFYCNFCGEKVNHNHSQRHLCPLQRVIPTLYFTKLAFLQLSFQGQGGAWCHECFKLEKTCKFCIDQPPNQRPNIASLLMETTYGHFDTYTFADFEIFNHVKYNHNSLICEYISQPFKFFQKKTGNKTFFNQEKKITYSRDIFWRNSSSVIEQILQFMISKDFSNTAVLINCSENNELYFFITALTKAGFIPKILKTQERLLLVECPELGLRLIDSQNYVQFKSYFFNLAMKEKETYLFFPKKLNKPRFYSYEGPCPDVLDFFCFDYGKNEEEQKNKFIDMIGKKPWNFRNAIYEHTKQKVYLNAKSILSFLQSCFDLQEMLCQVFKNTERTKILHPVNRPFVTFSSFIYQLFLIHVSSDIRMIRPPVPFQSSRGEVEFAEYLCHVFGSDKLRYAWSREGQTNHLLPICVPDIFDSKRQIAYFFNGCIIHNHQEQKCLFKRKKHGIIFKKSKKTFEEKVQALQHRNCVEQIKIMWQCQWNQIKKENQDVKEFLKKIYINPPAYRLDPTCAGNV